MTPVIDAPPRRRAQQPLDEYVRWISELCRQPGARSALRRGLRRDPGEAVTMHRYVAPWTEHVDPEDEWAYYTVAALIATQPPAMRPTADTHRADDAAGPGAERPDEPATPQKTTGREGTAGDASKRRPNLGATLAALGGDSDRAGSAERRLHLLVRQDVPGMQRHLPGLIRRLAAEHVRPDWGLLLGDLLDWRTRRNQVARRWLQAYYRARFREERAGSASPNDDPTGE